MKKIVLLRGRPASGKSTAFENLRKKKVMKNWIFIDFPKLKGILVKSLGDESGKKLAKSFLMSIILEAMKTNKDIILEEMSRETLENNIGKEIKQKKYEMIVFQFTVDTKEAIKRDIQRVKDPSHPHNHRIAIQKLHKMHDDKIDKLATVVDCNKLSRSQVVNLIIKKLIN